MCDHDNHKVFKSLLVLKVLICEVFIHFFSDSIFLGRIDVLKKIKINSGYTKCKSCSLLSIAWFLIELAVNVALLGNAFIMFSFALHVHVSILELIPTVYQLK